MPFTLDVLERFWDKVNKEGAFHQIWGQCWEWTASTRNGYGQIALEIGGNRKTWRVHRLSWHIHFGTIPNDLMVCHYCDNRLCVNPDHLFLGTHEDNMLDMREKSYIKGHRGKLTSLQVLEIKSLLNSMKPFKYGDLRNLARKFEVGEMVIHGIKSGRFYRWVN